MQKKEYSVRHYQGDLRLAVKSKNKESFTVFSPGVGGVVDLTANPQIPIYNDQSLKILFDNSVAYGHLMTSWLSVLVKDLERYSQEQITVLIYKNPEKPELYVESLTTITEYIKERVEDLGHKVEYLDTDSPFYIENFIYYNLDEHESHLQYSLEDLKPVSEFLSYGLPKDPPTLKLYLSRAKTTTSNGNFYNPLQGDRKQKRTDLDQAREEYKYKFSNRIDDEQALEEYLKSLGFIILYPEDFKTYRDQLSMISRAKILMSITSSSLSACLAMQKNTTVVELVTSLSMPKGPNEPAGSEYISALHDHYWQQSRVVNNFYVGISNEKKNAQEVIASIESNKDLKTLLSS